VARVGIITAASANPIDSAIYYRDMLLNYGAAETYWIPVHEDNKEANSDPDVVANIRLMTGFIFGGGDQARVISSFFNFPGRVESPALEAIRYQYNSLGAVVSGTSAGMACLTWPVMIAGGVSYNALENGSYPVGTEPGTDNLIYDPEGGINIMYDYVLDMHFSERGREGRLIRLLSDTRSLARGAVYGIGVDEDTALVITSADTTLSEGEVVGIAGVFIVDISAAFADPGSEYYKILDVNTHYITQGDKINLYSRNVTFDTTWKTDLKGQEQFTDAVQSNDIFGGVLLLNEHSEYVRVSTSLFDASLQSTTSGTTRERNPQFRVTFTQKSNSRGFGGISPVTGKWEISYSDLHVEINGS
jgi:cyanophycinase